MYAQLESGLMDSSRGQTARARREALGVSRDRLAQEAGLVSKTIKTYEEGARDNMPSAPRIEAALDRLEQQIRGGGTATRQHRRASDYPQRRTIEAMIEKGEGETVRAYLLEDGTRAIFVVPEGGRVPTPEEIERAIRRANGDE